MSMGATNREITVYSCDAGGCTVAKPVIDGDNYPETFITGTVDLTSDPTGRHAAWTACKVAHIGKAVTAIKESYSPGKAEPEDAEPVNAQAHLEPVNDDEEPPSYDGAATRSNEAV